MQILETLEVLVKFGVVEKDCKYEKLSGGTSSEVWLLKSTNSKPLILKFNEPITLKYECDFLNLYEGTDFFPKLIYCDKDFRYIVMTYIQGSIGELFFTNQLLQKLIEIVGLYVPVNSELCGWADAPIGWEAFLRERVNESKVAIESQGLQIDTFEIEECLSIIASYSFENYLLHGDFGVHNFIAEKGMLKCVIDPTPVIGDRIYDVLYALCSHPTFLEEVKSKEILSKLLEFGYDENIANAYLKVILFIRIGTSIKYHIDDLERYLLYFSKLSPSTN